MKTVVAVVVSCLVLLGAGSLTLIAWQAHHNRQLIRSSEAMASELRQAQASVSVLSDERASLKAQLKELESREHLLSERIDSLEAAAKAGTEIVPKPYRVRAFVGQDSVGGAWIVPHNVTRDTESGRYVFEPVLVIDASAKKHFTVHHTNVVEREVYTTEIYQEGYNYPYAYYAIPGRPGIPGHRPQPPIVPPSVGTSPTIQPDARARLFAPPNSLVTSRPQVLGIPATTPVNARVFAP